MATYHFGGIRVVLGETDATSRKRHQAALLDAGFQAVMDVLEARDAAELARAGRADLLILDTALPGGDVARVVRDVRHGVGGANPFLAIITLLPVPEAGLVRRMADAGVDDIVVKPVAPATLLARIKTLARSRKPFVVTRDYIGPDRRRAERAEPQRLPLIEVPNILQSKALATTDSITLQRMIETVTARINAEKADRHVSELEEIVPRLRAAHEATGNLSGAERELARLEEMADDLAARLRGSHHAHMAEVALSLAGISARLAAQPEQPHRRDMELLEKVVVVLGRTFGHEGAAIQAREDLSSRVTDYTRARASA